MDLSFDLLESVMPEALENIRGRYNILSTVKAKAPVGRRVLSSSTGITERRIRNDVELLCDLGLVRQDVVGISLTQKGESVLEELTVALHEFFGLEALETELEKRLGIAKAVIVKGDCDETPAVMNILAEAAASVISSTLSSGDSVAVTGGTTLRATVKMIDAPIGLEGVTVVPARGGIGRDIDTQSNTIAALFADRIGGEHRALHLPDMLGARAARTVLKDPTIKKAIDELKNVNMAVFGIGVAKEMALRRNLSQAIIDLIERRGGVGEAFGYYFEENGDIVYSSHTVGMSMEMLLGVKKLIGVAGGSKKAKAIMAVIKNIPHCVLVTDEGAARAICQAAK
ncbi:MAG: hypothetical protein E7315_04625 [Clostridiales bacterium]|nr:hypothetical protein [Clostridiales bacterium]